MVSEPNTSLTPKSLRPPVAMAMAAVDFRKARRLSDMTILLERIWFA